MIIPTPYDDEINDFDDIPTRAWIEAYTLGQPTSDFVIGCLKKVERDVKETMLKLEDENFVLRPQFANADRS